MSKHSLCRFVLTITPRSELLITMKAIPINEQRRLVDRLMTSCGGSYSSERRRKYYITGPQWAAAYEGQALFHAPARKPVTFEEVSDNRLKSESGTGVRTTPM